MRNLDQIREKKPSAEKRTTICINFVCSYIAGTKASSISLAALAAIILSISQPGVADCATGSKKPLGDIDKLELKFFHRTYADQALESRLERVEQRVYGEGKEGPSTARISSLLELVPDLPGNDDSSQNTASSASKSETGAGDPVNRPVAKKPLASPSRVEKDSGAQYPSVSAIEKKLFGREFADDGVTERLARLETKVFGKPSGSSDLSERMDKLKMRTGVDVAAVPPPETDWNDEEDDEIDFPAPRSPLARNYPSVSPRQREDGRSFSGRDYGQDLNRAFGRSPNGSSAPGAYGMGGGSTGSGFSSSSGSYGFGGSGLSSGQLEPGNSRRLGSGSTGAIASGSGISSGFGAGSISGAGANSGGFPPKPAPSRHIQSNASAMGINQQVEALEKEIFGTVQKREPLPERVSRLEKTVFAERNQTSSMGLPERVARLRSVVPISTPSTIAQQTYLPPQNQGIYQDPSYADPSMSGQSTQRGGGLSKILNSIGNFVGGGMSVGGFPVAPGNLVTDPSTGMLVDRMTGNLIDPYTGAVRGRIGTGFPPMNPGFGGIGTFNNGFSPYYGNPGFNSIPGVRFGGGGLNFGTGMGGFGGMWP